MAAISLREYYDEVKAVAQEKQIPWQNLVGSRERPDSASFQTGGEGAAVIGLSVPVKYARTSAAMLEKSDYENTVALLKQYLAQL